MKGTTREEMVALVKAAGREVEQRAEDLVGNADGMTDLDIWLRFPLRESPQITVTRDYKSKECFDVLLDRRA